MRLRRRDVAVALIAVETASALAARARGHTVGGRVVVRCRQGHLFTTLWIPGASVKALRLGWWRVQRCPVGRHWSLVSPVRESDLTQRQLRDALAHRDVSLP
jgi:hypothetical protein